MPQKEKSARDQTIYKPVYEPALPPGVEVNQHISAKDDVYAAQPIVMLQIVVIKYHAILHLVGYGKKSLFFSKILLHIMLIYSLQLVRAVQARLGPLKRAKGQIRRVNAQRPDVRFRQTFKDRHHRCVRLLASRAPRAPYPYAARAQGSLTRQQLRQDHIFQ